MLFLIPRRGRVAEHLGRGPFAGVTGARAIRRLLAGLIALLFVAADRTRAAIRARRTLLEALAAGIVLLAEQSGRAIVVGAAGAANRALAS